MTLSFIKAMFQVGSYWKCDRSIPWPNQQGIYRRVAFQKTNDLLWDIGSQTHLYTRWPKASEIISAIPGKLSFKYKDFDGVITLTLLQGTEAESAAQFIASIGAANAALRASKQREDAEAKARLDAEARAALHATIIEGKPISSYQLIETLRDNGFSLTPGTIGALRKKVITADPDGYQYYKGKRPRFTYENQPSILYRKLQNHLLAAALIPASPSPTPPISTSPPPLPQGASVTPQQLPVNPIPTAALDLFAA